jgi:hypothetical protein
MAERMVRRGRPGGPAQAIKQQELVAGVDQRMDRFAQHGGAASDGCGKELGDRNRSVARQGSENYGLGTVSRHLISRIFAADDKGNDAPRDQGIH